MKKNDAVPALDDDTSLGLVKYSEPESLEYMETSTPSSSPLFPGVIDTASHVAAYNLADFITKTVFTDLHEIFD